MAVYTEVSDDALRQFLADFDIGDLVAFRGIAEGVENSNFYLQTDSGAFILTLYEKRMKADDLPFFLGLMAHLESHGIACPQPVQDKNGAQWSMFKGRAAAILTFLNGISLRKPQVAHCQAAGATMAALHEAGKDFALTRPNALSVAGWQELAAATVTRAEAVQGGLGALITTSLTELEAGWPSGLPQGVIHADLFPDNVLFTGDRLSGVIDFYFACNDMLAYDLAVMLNSWCFEIDGAYNVTKGRAMIAGYRGARQMSDAEIAAMPLLMRGAALRFLLTRLYDWLNPDPNALVRPKDPREYAKKLRFHLAVKNPGEYGF